MTSQPGDVLVPWGEPWTALSRSWLRSSHKGLDCTDVLGGNPSVDTIGMSLNADTPDPSTVFIKPRVDAG